MAQRFDINDDWFFAEQFEDNMIKPDYDENGMQKVRIPHTVKETPYDYFDESVYQMVSGYRRHIRIPEKSG